MKKGKLAFFCACIVTLMMSCSEDVDPAVKTLYLEDGTRETLRGQAFQKIYEFYFQSDKSSEYYEVIARKKDSYIVNYSPSEKLLTICQDPGSGWSNQVQNVNIDQLKRLADLKISLDDIGPFVHKDSTLKSVNPIVEVKTNGNPSL